MKKNLRLCSMLLVAGITVFSACKKSDSSSSIVGTWEVTKTHDVYVDSTGGAPYVPEITDSVYTHGKSHILKFSSNGALTDSSETDGIVESGTYIASNGKLTVSSIGFTETVSYSISGNTLTTISSDNTPGIDSDAETDTYTKQ